MPLNAFIADNELAALMYESISTPELLWYFKLGLWSSMCSFFLTLEADCTFSTRTKARQTHNVAKALIMYKGVEVEEIKTGSLNWGAFWEGLFVFFAAFLLLWKSSVLFPTSKWSWVNFETGGVVMYSRAYYMRFKKNWEQIRFSICHNTHRFRPLGCCDYIRGKGRLVQNKQSAQ